jgi:ligand-binding sensor domain-containing protein/anti-sigma regulatory factor (Ser/Thr protein kinase)
MHFLRQIPFLVIFAFTGIKGPAQTGGYAHETFGTRNGLLSSKTFALAQGSNRLLWIGSELGLSSFNGYSFSNYQYTSGNTAIGRILCITEDSLKGIWAGGDKGLFYCKGGIIKKIERHNGLPLAIEALLTDAAGNIWAGDLAALYRITPGQVDSVSNKGLASLHLAPYAAFTKRVFSLAADSRQHIYAASFDGVFRLAGNTGSWQCIWNNPAPANYVQSVAVTSPDSIFWNCYDGPPVKMINGRITPMYHRNFTGRNVFIHQRQPYAVTTRNIAVIGAQQAEPVVFFEGLTNMAFTAIIDAESNIWIATWEGLIRFRKTAFTQYKIRHTDHTESFSFTERANGELLFGGNRGNVFTKTAAGIIPHPAIPRLFQRSEVLCMYEAAGGSLWAGSGYEGITRFKNNTVTNWKQAGFLKDNNCEVLYAVNGDKIFACTERGVTVLNPALAEPFTAHYDFKKQYSRYPELYGCIETGPGPSWFFYGSQGIYKLTDNQLVDDSIKGMPVKNLYVNKMVSDGKQNIWIATQGKGLLQCRFNGQQLELMKQYDQQAGLPSDNAMSVLVDKNGNVWLGDYMSLSVIINPGKGEQLISFNENDGLLSTYYQTLKLEQQRNGTIWGLSTTGMFAFHPDSMVRNNVLTVPVIDKLVVNDNNPGKTYTITPDEAGMQQAFSSGDNSMQFHFTAVCLTDPSKIRYAYRLLGLDSNWVVTASRKAGFNFLPPGDYIFELKACNNNNVWTKDAVRFRFSVQPPFWKTGWFILLCLLGAGGLIYFFVRRNIRSIKLKAALQQQMSELEARALRAQMNPHFIFNCLNAIQELVVMQHVDAAYQYLSKFSRLLRMVLNNSEKSLIALSSEVEMNLLYLDLESLRFKNSFSYQVVIDEQVEAETTLVPSLLLQPFIENAIWHGLAHKQGEKKLTVHFHTRDNTLICSITDNGVGREKAAQIKAQKIGSQHFESRGIGLSILRINTQYSGQKDKCTVEITDVKDKDGGVCGTKVVITIPYTNYLTNTGLYA